MSVLQWLHCFHVRRQDRTVMRGLSFVRLSHLVFLVRKDSSLTDRSVILDKWGRRILRLAELLEFDVVLKYNFQSIVDIRGNKC